MIETVPELGSTNAELLARLEAGKHIGEGAWLVADRQTAGRGRAGRAWSDGAGNFMGSTAALLRHGDPPAQTLALVAGLVVHRTVAGLLPAAAPLLLKWPNDVLLGEAKLAGILLERRGDVVVVGIGVNIAAAPPADRPTAALADYAPGASRDGFAAALAQEWARTLAAWHAGGWPSLRRAWSQRAHQPGARLTVRDAAGAILSGAFTGIGEDGTAYLRLADGTAHAIHAGDVELVGGEPTPVNR